MPSAVNVAGEMVGAATALAGLTLIFLGAIATSYGAYTKAEQNSVRNRYQARGWFAFIGFVLALLSALLALVAKWLANECTALVAMALLFAAVAWVFMAGLSAVREIR